MRSLDGNEYKFFDGSEHKKRSDGKVFRKSGSDWLKSSKTAYEFDRAKSYGTIGQEPADIDEIENDTEFSDVQLLVLRALRHGQAMTRAELVKRTARSRGGIHRAVNTLSGLIEEVKGSKPMRWRLIKGVKVAA